LKTELKQKRDFIKKNYDQSVKQIGYLKQMEFLLQEKLKLKRTGKEERLRGTEQRKGQMDILIMNE
jgi:hypothetical protein